MKYIVNIEHPTPDVLRQIWFAVMQQKENITGTLPEPTSTNGGDMKVFIQIMDAEPSLIAGIGKVVTLIDSAKKPKPTQTSFTPEENERQLQIKPARKQMSKFKWGRVAKRNLNMRTPEAPYGLRKDGTPRKPSGRIAHSMKKNTLF